MELTEKGRAALEDLKKKYGPEKGQEMFNQKIKDKSPETKGWIVGEKKENKTTILGGKSTAAGFRSRYGIGAGGIAEFE